ncbi:MAG: hypothetical protein WCK89_25800 [bacterium]
MEKLRQELPVVCEIDAQHDRDDEDELSMMDGIEDSVGDIFSELNSILGMAAEAEPPSLEDENHLNESGQGLS